MASGKELKQLKSDDRPVRCVAFSPDSRRALSAGIYGIVHLWDLASGKEVCRMEGHTMAVNSVAFSPDGRRAVSGSDDRTVRLWQLPELRRCRLKIIEMSRPIILEQARQRAVGQDSAVRLAAGAVVGLVVGVADPLHGRTADGTGLAKPAVHGHAGTKRGHLLGPASPVSVRRRSTHSRRTVRVAV